MPYFYKNRLQCKQFYHTTLLKGNKMKFFMLIVFSIFIFTYAKTEILNSDGKTLTVKGLLNEVEGGSLTLKTETANYEESVAKKIESRAAFLPTLNLNYTDLFDKRYVFNNINFAGSPSIVPQIIPQSALTLNAVLPLFDGWATVNRYQGAKSQELAAWNKLQWNKFKVARQAILQFYKVIGSKKLEEVAKQNVLTLEDHFKNISLIKKVGSATNYDVLKVDVQLSEAQAEYLNAKDNIEIEKNKLALIMGKSEEIRDIQGELPSLNQSLIKNINLSSEEIYRQRLDLISLQSEETSYDNILSAQRRHWVPKIYLFGQYQSYNNQTDNFDDYDQYRDAYQFGVALSWNIFDGFASSSKAEQALQQKSKIDIELSEEKIKSKQDLELWKRKFLYYCLLAKSKEDEVEKATESLRLAKTGHRVGTRTNKDLLDAENELFHAKAAQVQSRVSSIEALIQLEMTIGKELYAF